MILKFCKMIWRKQWVRGSLILCCLSISIFCKIYLLKHKQNHCINKHFSHLPVLWYLTFKNIVADYYWLQMLCDDNLECNSCYAYSDFVTDLDLHFNIVYRYASIFLTNKSINADYTVSLLEKSLQSPINKVDWRIYFYLAYNHYFFNKNPKKAFAYLNQVKFLSSHNAQEIPQFLFSWQNKLKKEFKNSIIF
ncbi:MAG: hypothetical protein WDZ41_00445 [Candidatus Babeliales bacterium]